MAGASGEGGIRTRDGGCPPYSLNVGQGCGLPPPDHGTAASPPLLRRPSGPSLTRWLRPLLPSVLPCEHEGPPHRGHARRPRRRHGHVQLRLPDPRLTGRRSVQIMAATEPTPGQVNEDFVITAP